jgi:hypothetical protein
MAKRIVVGVQVANRATTIQQVQQIFTNYGCNIKTRIGLHQVSDTSCSPSGLILLEMFGDEAKAAEMEDKLNDLDGVTTKRMEFKV